MDWVWGKKKNGKGLPVSRLDFELVVPFPRVTKEHVFYRWCISSKGCSLARWAWERVELERVRYQRHLYAGEIAPGKDGNMKWKGRQMSIRGLKFNTEIYYEQQCHFTYFSIRRRTLVVSGIILFLRHFLACIKNRINKILKKLLETRVYTFEVYII